MNVKSPLIFLPLFKNTLLSDAVSLVIFTLFNENHYLMFSNYSANVKEELDIFSIGEF